VEYAIVGGQATRLVNFYTSNQATENKDNSSSFDKSLVNNTAAPQRRLVQPMTTREQLEALQNSSAYRGAQPDKWETKRCKAQFQWQKETFMTCNIHHELDMTVLIKNNNNTGKEDDENDESLLRLVANVSVIVII
jgi:hypothetical protein